MGDLAEAFKRCKEWEAKQRQKQEDKNYLTLRKIGLNSNEAQAWLTTTEDYPHNLVRRDDKLTESEASHPINRRGVWGSIHGWDTVF